MGLYPLCALHLAFLIHIFMEVMHLFVFFAAMLVVVGGNANSDALALKTELLTQSGYCGGGSWSIANALVTEESSKNECPISQSQICYERWNGPAFFIVFYLCLDLSSTVCVSLPTFRFRGSTSFQILFCGGMHYTYLDIHSPMEQHYEMILGTYQL